MMIMDNAVASFDVITPQHRRAESLAARLFALEEPWRSRFLELIAAHAEISSPADLTEDVVADWLRNQSLYKQVRLMLRTWTNKGL